MKIPRIKLKYYKETRYIIKKKMNYKSIMQVPKLTKICINQGIGSAVSDKKLIKIAIEEITAITGQKAIATKSKTSISNFKLRENMKIGVKVTLRRNKMYEFFDRLVTISLPRVRDFKGIGINGFDGNGNYNLGVKEQIIFPEIKINKINKLTGMNITFVTSAKNNKESYEILNELGMPFKKK
ncbi:MAG: 50S ribosomal protein L5 [Cytophagales bacterium]